MVTFDRLPDVAPDVKLNKEKLEKIEELSGKLDRNNSDENKLMHSVIESDQETIDDGKLIAESINQSMGSFTPDLMFKNMVKDYKLAQKLYGETIVRELTGYPSDYIEKNINIPEFKKELKKRIEERIHLLQEKGLVDKDFIVTDKAIKLSSLVLYAEELTNLVPKGWGEKKEKKKSLYGDKKDYVNFKKTRYRDIAIKQSVKTAIRRGHTALEKDDIRIFERQKKGKINIIYAIDSSGSMKGDKLKTCKKAGIALAFKAITEKNKVGLIVFGSDIKAAVPPTENFNDLIEELTKIRAAMETDIAKTIEKALEMFPPGNATKHLVILTDAIPTKGDEPERATMEAVSKARNAKITISLVGIKLDEKGEELAKKIAEVGAGKLYVVKDLEKLDKIILEDYYSVGQ